MNSATLPLHDLLARGPVAGCDDGELLDRFRADRDEIAFAALVARHGPMVWATARGIARDEHDAADAFQATFLILARRADSVRFGSSLAAWLHRVAHRSAVAAERAARSRRRHERAAARLRTLNPTGTDLTANIQAELARLPATYRLPLILCDLEGLTYAEAAARLDCTEAALRNRLARARARLKLRLGDGLGVASLGLPRPLIATNLIRATTALALDQARGSVVVMTLARLAGRGFGTIWFTSVVPLLVTGGLVTLGTVALTRNQGVVPDPPVRPMPVSAPALAHLAEPIRGRVVGPTGEPVGGALVWVTRVKQGDQISSPVTTTADGRFLFADPPEVGSPLAPKYSTLVAGAPGFGIGWVAWRDTPKHEIHLVAEGPALEGHILDEAGRPVVGADVKTKTLYAVDLTHPEDNPPAHRIQMLADDRPKWTGLISTPISLTTTTDPSGWFRLGGIGRDRVVALQVASPSITETDLLAMTLDNPPGPIPRVGKPRLGEILFHARRFEVVVGTRRDVEGVVREAVSGQPLADWQVVIGNSFDRHRMEREEVRTDAAGRYHLPRFVGHEVDVDFLPPSGQPYPPGRITAQVGPTPAPLVVNFDVHRLPLLRGRITDQATGLPVAGSLEAIALPGNPNLDGYPGFDPRRGISKGVDDDGTFALPVLPGPSLVAFYARDTGHYRTGLGADRLPGHDPKTQRVPIAYDPRTRRRAGDVDSPSIHADRANFLVAIEADLATPLEPLACQLEPVPEVAVTLLDPASQPIRSAWIETTGDLNASKPVPPKPDGRWLLRGFAPDGSSRIDVRVADRKLAGSLRVSLDHGPAQTIRLAPWGEIVGRVVQPDGTPVPRTDLVDGPHFSLQTRPKSAASLPHSPVHYHRIITDDAGRFQIEGLVPGLAYGASIDQRDGTIIGDLFDALTVKPGEVKDLGDVVIRRPD